MSEAQELSPNTRIELRAADWLSRQQYEDWDDAQQAALDTWLAESDNHVAAYWRLAATFRRTDRLAALRGAEIEHVNSPIKKRRWPVLPISAAVLAFVTAVGAAAYLFPASHTEIFSTAVGGHSALTLADGSQIELNTDTLLRADIGARSRNIELVRGEAYFQVRHDAARPFVVTVGNHRIVDLGTKFFVRRMPKGIEVALVEGRARLENTGAGKQHFATLVPGDLAVATANSLNLSRRHAPELADDLAWRHDALVFHNTSLGDAAAEFNRYSGAKLVVADASTAALTVNGTFRTTGAEEFAGVTHEIFGVHIVHLGNNIVLSR